MRLVLDFDGTITQKDTIDELAQAAISLQRRRTGQDFQPVWNHAVQAYLKDYESYESNFSPPESLRKDMKAEMRFLKGLKDAEEASLSRVSASALFAGLQRDDLFQMGVEAVASGRVSKTEGFDEFLLSAGEKGLKMDITSVNWSKAFIEGILHPQHLPVAANEISENGEIQGPQHVGSRITTSPDKLNALRHITQTDHEPVLYLGDSTTDLECLLYSHGVIIARDAESALLTTLSRIGVDVPHIGNLQNLTHARLFWARDFLEVLASGALDQ
ncbi:hypothetical protein ED733_004883 [Metarhizium rileyi]|uniref:HAD-like domain protein n=1 Tax=Metarhizium rileyi (strain RCEF 4871) TaxID=1649241 RepID=A0A5C6GN45_METRR|nr:hypothetical protein ED733_004883 [Metarhizium rileyi]